MQWSTMSYTIHSILILTTFFVLPPEFDENPLSLLSCSKDGSDQTLFLFNSPTLESAVFILN